MNDTDKQAVVVLALAVLAFGGLVYGVVSVQRMRIEAQLERERMIQSAKTERTEERSVFWQDLSSRIKKED